MNQVNAGFASLLQQFAAQNNQNLGSNPPVQTTISKAVGCGTYTFTSASYAGVVGYLYVTAYDSASCSPLSGSVTISGSPVSYSFACCTKDNCNMLKQRIKPNNLESIINKMATEQNRTMNLTELKTEKKMDLNKIWNETEYETEHSFDSSINKTEHDMNKGKLKSEKNWNEPDFGIEQELELNKSQNQTEFDTEKNLESVVLTINKTKSKISRSESNETEKIKTETKRRIFKFLKTLV